MSETSWIVLSACFVLLMQAGFLLIEAGSVRAKNAMNVAQKNVSDFVISALVFAIVGFAIMFGAGTSGFFGWNGMPEVAGGAPLSAHLLFQLAFCGVAATIVSGILAERVKLLAYFIIVALVAAAIYPVMGHMVWGGLLVAGNAAFLADLGFVDHAGGIVVHTLGASIGLGALLVVGPRIGRFDHEGRVQPIAGNSPVLVMAGGLILIICWVPFNTGLMTPGSAALSAVALNTVIAAAGGGFGGMLVGVLLSKGVFKPLDSVNGMLGGAVAITSCAHLLGLEAYGLMGILGGAGALAANHVLLKGAKLDDPVGAIGVHGAAGILGAVLFPLLTTGALPAGNVVAQLGIQAIGAGLCVIGGVLIGFAVFKLLDLVVGVRVGAFQERMGLDYAEHQASLTERELETVFSSEYVTEATAATAGPQELATGFNAVTSAYQRSVSELNAIKTEAEDAANLLTSALNSTMDGIVIWDADRKITKFNRVMKAFVRMYNHELALGQTFRDLANSLNAQDVLLPDADGPQNAVLDWLHDDEAFFATQSVVWGMPGPVWVSMRTQPVRTGGYITMFVNVSEQVIARQKAELAERAKSEFLANMSHEIRTPLNGVIGMAEILAHSDLPTRERSFVDTIIQSGHALLTIINDILDFSKIDAGRMTLEADPFDLRDCIESVGCLLATQAAAKSIDLLIKMSHDLPSIYIGDAGRVRQVMTNLVGNAVKFTKSGHVLIEVSGQVVDHTANLTIRVEDTGVGIPEQALETIFDKFSQVDGSSTRSHDGTGLGLAISKRLIELMGGRISVTSQLGKGSCFAISVGFPVGEQAPNPKPIPRSIIGTRVLVVDDNSVNRDILQEQLRHWKCLPQSVASGTQAYRYLAEAEKRGLVIDLIILDYQMPDIDGIEVLSRLRKTRTYRHTPVIMLSSVDGPEFVRRLSVFEGVSCLTKPARSSALFDAISSSVSAGPTDASIAVPHVVADAADSWVVERATPADTVIAPDGQLDILVAEDNAVNQRFMETLLSGLNVNFKIVEDGAKAVTAWKTYSPKLILMDVSMPNMNGLQATEIIRSAEASYPDRAATIIVAVTAHALNGDETQFLSRGMDGYVAKPIRMDDFTARLGEWLGRDLTRTSTKSA